MTRGELTQKKNQILQRQQEVKTEYQQVKARLEEVSEQWLEAIKARNSAQEKLDHIREMAGDLGTVPTLTKLRNFLASIRELFED